MYLPTPQFSRLITVLAFDLADSSLDSMIIAWDHIATRHLRQLSSNREQAGQIESIRLLAVHDAIRSILEPGSGFIFNDTSTGTTVAAALAATAQASHDILAHAFDSHEDRLSIRDSLEESLSLISNEAEKAVGSAAGSASAAAFLSTFRSLKTRSAPDASGSFPLHDQPNQAVRGSMEFIHDSPERALWPRSA